MNQLNHALVPPKVYFAKHGLLAVAVLLLTSCVSCGRGNSPQAEVDVRHIAIDSITILAADQSQQDTVCIENMIISNSKEEVNHLLKNLMGRDDFPTSGDRGYYMYDIIVNDSLEVVDIKALGYYNQDISRLIQEKIARLKFKPIDPEKICSLNELPFTIQIRTKTISFPDTDNFYKEAFLRLGAD